MRDLPETPLPETPLMEARDISRVFRVKSAGRTVDLHAVSDLSLALYPGKTLGILGESGCGKTTLNRMLLALDSPTKGAITFRGRDVAGLDATGKRDMRRAVQPVFQNPFSSLDPRMRVGTIVAEPLQTIPEMTRAQRLARVGEVLEAVGLRATDARRFPNEFSGGQRQRIAIARAIASRPEVLMLDEPVSSQDISIRAQILNVLKDLQDEYGLATVFISHDLATVRFMAHEVMVMYLGRVVERGPAAEICTRPAHPYTRALLAAALPPDPDAPRPDVAPRGELPSPLDPPSGCAYRTRCPFATEICASQRPLLRPTPTGAAACHLI